MKWLNIELSHLRSPEYIGSDPVQRATWLNLIAYCCEQENGGRIKNCSAWKTRMWEQACGVTQAEVTAPSQLFQWAGNDLLIWNYPSSREAELQAKREAGRKGGLASGASRKEKPSEAESVKNNGEHKRNEAEVQPLLEGELEGKGKEGKGMEVQVPLYPQKQGWVPNEAQLRLNALFGRRQTTRWSEKELRAFKTINGTISEDLPIIERYYQAKIPSEKDFRRRDLCTLLNNWNGEVDRALQFSQTKTDRLF